MNRPAALVTAGGGGGDILRVTPLVRVFFNLGYEVDVLLAPDYSETVKLLEGAPEIRQLFYPPSSWNRDRQSSIEGLDSQVYEIATFTVWSMSLRSMARTRRIIAFDCAILISLSLEVNGFLQRAEVVRKAVSDRDGCLVILNVPRRRAMNASVSHNRNDAMEAIEVETVTLDRVVKDWPRIDLIKIDAEGAEESIWRGMRQTISRNPGITIVMEVNCLRYAEPRAFFREIEGAGFPLRYIGYDGTVNETTEEQIMTWSGGEDWMLFLRRGRL